MVHYLRRTTLALRPGFNQNTLARNDDGSTSLVSLGFPVCFFGAVYTSAYVNNNGNITFDAPLSNYTPVALNSIAREIIAPFFADVDTRLPSPGATQYGIGNVGSRPAFGVTWNCVGYFDGKTDKLNSFQLILINRSDTGANNFDFEFRYEKIQ